jgi:hypothetical protein
MVDEASSLFRGLVTAYRNRLHEQRMTINRLFFQPGAVTTIAWNGIQGPVFADRGVCGGEKAGTRIEFPATA